MIIFDVETSGVNPDVHGFLSIGAVDMDDPEREPFFEECRLRDGAHVSEEADEQMHDATKQSERSLLERFIKWVMESKDHTLGGQNPSFDTSFIEASCKRFGVFYPFAHRTIDLHSICYAHVISHGMIVPLHNGHTSLNSDKIMEYVGIPAEPKPHIALNGAKYEVEALSRLLYNKSFYPEFAKYKIPWMIG